MKNSTEKDGLELCTEISYCIHAKIIKSKLSTTQELEVTRAPWILQQKE